MERLLHLLTDVTIMQVQLGAIEEILKARVASNEIVDSEERDKINALLKKVVSRFHTKARSFYEALR